MNRRIVVPLDGSRFGEHALPTAISLARRLGAPLELVTVALPKTPGAQGQGGTGIRGDDSRDRGHVRAESYLDEVSGRIRAGGYEGKLTDTVMTAGNTASSIVRHVVEVDAGLVVMTTHGRGPLQRAWLGSTTDGVIRRSPCPVLLIRPDDKEDEGGPDTLDLDLGVASEPFRKVLIPLDGSDASEVLVELVGRFTPDDADVTLLRVVAPLAPGGSPYLPHVVSEGRDQESVRAGAREYLQEVAGRHDLGARTVAIETRVQGQPGVAILDLARNENFDLIAMSTTGRGGVTRMLLGSVADKVVRGAPCPILVHRAAGVD